MGGAEGGGQADSWLSASPTLYEIESWMLTQLSHPGTPFLLVFQSCIALRSTFYVVLFMNRGFWITVNQRLRASVSCSLPSQVDGCVYFPS